MSLDLLASTEYPTRLADWRQDGASSMFHVDLFWSCPSATGPVPGCRRSPARGAFNIQTFPLETNIRLIVVSSSLERVDCDTLVSSLHTRSLYVFFSSSILRLDRLIGNDRPWTRHGKLVFLISPGSPHPYLA